MFLTSASTLLSSSSHGVTRTPRRHHCPSSLSLPLQPTPAAYQPGATNLHLSCCRLSLSLPSSIRLAVNVFAIRWIGSGFFLLNRIFSFNCFTTCFWILLVGEFAVDSFPLERTVCPRMLSRDDERCHWSVCFIKQSVWAFWRTEDLFCCLFLVEMVN